MKNKQETSEVYKQRIKKWVEALRSGEYSQGTGGLKDGDNYCCLGVACDLTDGHFDENYFVSHNGGGQDTDFLPPGVQKYYGFNDFNPVISSVVGITKKNIHITVLNDDYKCSFEELADLIEKEYL